MNGCVLHVDVRTGFSLCGGTDSDGRLSFAIPLGDAPVFFGDLYLQWFYLDPLASRPHRVSGTRGLEVRIRP